MKRGWRANHRWGEPAERGTLRAFLLKPSRTLLRAGKVHPFISVTCTVLLLFWSATELAPCTHVEHKGVKSCWNLHAFSTWYKSAFRTWHSSTKLQWFFRSNDWHENISNSYILEYYNCWEQEEQFLGFLVIRKLLEGGWYFPWGKKDQIILSTTPQGKMASEQFILYRTTIFFFDMHSAMLENHNLERSTPNRSMSFIVLHLLASLNLSGLSQSPGLQSFCELMLRWINQKEERNTKLMWSCKT